MIINVEIPKPTPVSFQLTLTADELKWLGEQLPHKPLDTGNRDECIRCLIIEAMPQSIPSYSRPYTFRAHKA